MKKSVKAASNVLWVILLIVVVAVSIGGAFMLGGGAPAVAEQPVTVYIDKVKQEGNYTVASKLDWGTISAGNTYTKNFTVVNNQQQSLTLKLYATAPSTATVTWAKNGTTVPSGDKAEATLVLSLSDTYTTGSFTWRLLAVNGTSTPTPTPTATGATPTPKPTPVPNNLQFTIDGDSGVKNITITRNSQTPFVIIMDDLPQTYLYTAGDTLKFQVAIQPDFMFNGWQFGDGSLPENTNPLIITDKTVPHNTNGNFTLTANTVVG